MYICYLDESGTPQQGAQTTHFILIGLAIPAVAWRVKDKRVNDIKLRYGLKDIEVHTGFLARRFPEQEKIPNFDKLDSIDRRAAVKSERDQSLIKAAAIKSADGLRTLKKLYAKTCDYVHLTHQERMHLLCDLADEIGSWNDARLFGEAVDKTAVAPGLDIFVASFEQLVTRFHMFLSKREDPRRFSMEEEQTATAKEKQSN